MVGSATAKIAAKNKPKPTFLTEGGDAELRDKAETLEKFVAGVFYEEKVYANLCKVFRDACIYGTGFLLAYSGDSKVCVERVRPVEIVVDDLESIDGDPPNIYRRKYVDRRVLTHTWAKDDEELAGKITDAASDTEDLEYSYQTSADQILVTESWHVGEADGVMGRHCITIDGADLLDEEWEGPHPFAVLRWTDDVEGFFGVGLVEELRGIQEEINKLVQQIQRGHHLIAGHWLVEQGAKVQSQHINNDLAAIVRYTGTAPRYEAPQAINPAVYQHLWDLYAKAFEVTGISQLNATGQKPAGLDSGVAQRTYQDIQTERFLEVGQAFEELVIDTARQVIRCAKRAGGSTKVRAPGKGKLDVIRWSDIKLKEDMYAIRVHPTSMIPSSPAGKQAWAQDMINSGAIPPEDVLDILDYPDTEQYQRRKNAARLVIERNVEWILKRGEFVSPEPADDHKLAMRIVTEAYHCARLDGVSEDKLELLRRYLAYTVDFLSRPPPQPSPGALPMPDAPMPPQGQVAGAPPPPDMPMPPQGGMPS